MKKYKLIINIILIAVIVFSVISFSLTIPSCSNYLSGYNELESWGSLANISELKGLKDYFLQTLFAIIFSALSAIASAVTLFLLNFKVWKKSKLDKLTDEDNHI